MRASSGAGSLPRGRQIRHLTSISPLVADGSTGPGTAAAVAEAGPPPGTSPSTVPAALPAGGMNEQLSGGHMQVCLPGEAADREL